MVDGASGLETTGLDVEALVRQLIEHEGLKLRPYRDTVNKLTIGVGRNLTDRGISRPEALYLLNNDVLAVQRDLDRRAPWWRGLDPVRQLVLADMSFNLGIHGLMRFAATLGALQAGDYRRAAAHMRNSKWGRQVGVRAERLARMVERGAAVPLSEVR